MVWISLPKNREEEIKWKLRGILDKSRGRPYTKEEEEIVEKLHKELIKLRTLHKQVIK